MPASRAAFRFTNTSPAFAFTATLGDRGQRRPLERLTDPAALGSWLQEAGLVSNLLAVTDQDFGQALVLREAIHRTGTAIASSTAPDPSDIDALNRMTRHRPSRPRLSPGADALTWQTASVREALSALAGDAVVMYSHPELRSRIRICSNPKCGGLFVDGSRAGTRRWCSMRTCGAAAKKRAYRARLTSTPAG